MGSDTRNYKCNPNLDTINITTVGQNTFKRHFVDIATNIKISTTQQCCLVRSMI